MCNRVVRERARSCALPRFSRDLPDHLSQRRLLRSEPLGWRANRDHREHFPLRPRAASSVKPMMIDRGRGRHDGDTLARFPRFKNSLALLLAHLDNTLQIRRFAPRIASRSGRPTSLSTSRHSRLSIGRRCAGADQYPLQSRRSHRCSAAQSRALAVHRAGVPGCAPLRNPTARKARSGPANCIQFLECQTHSLSDDRLPLAVARHGMFEQRGKVLWSLTVHIYTFHHLAMTRSHGAA